MESIKEILTALSKEHTQEGIARGTKISLRSVQNYMKGEEPGPTNARKIRDFYANAGKPPQNSDVFGLLSGKVIQIEAMQRVQLTVLQELYAKALNIPNMEAGSVIDRTLGMELQKLKEELKQQSS